jgi:hypothetical protein
MICVRCGHCCFSMPVIINVNGRAKMKPHDTPCPHLELSGEDATICKVHGEPWYEGSPCHTYGNSDVDPDFAHKKGRQCLVGLAVKEQGGMKKLVDMTWRPNVEDLQDLGEWPK